MKALWPDLKGYRAQLVLGPLFKLAEAILELLVPLLMADIIDVGVKTGDVRYIVTHGLAMLGLGAVGLGARLPASISPPCARRALEEACAAGCFRA